MNKYLEALLVAGLPFFLFTIVILFWVVKKGQKLPKEKSGKLEEEALNSMLDDASLSRQKDDDKKNDILTAKWLKFGGGFYGMASFLTFLVAEAKDITSLFDKVFSIELSIDNLISEVIIKFFIESIMNIVQAFTWPVYWMSRSEGYSFWMLLIAAYLGYWLATKVLHIYFKNNPQP